jgi:hypothetical protein
LQVVGNERSLKNWKILRYFWWNKSDLKDGRRDGESNKVFPLTPPSPPGRGRTCERFVKARGMSTSIPRTEARHHGSSTITYTTERLGAIGLPDEPSGSPSPLGRGRGEGERSDLQP